MKLADSSEIPSSTCYRVFGNLAEVVKLTLYDELCIDVQLESMLLHLV